MLDIVLTGYCSLVTKLEDGTFIGPFGIQLHTPALGHHFLAFIEAIDELPGLSARGREIASVVVGAHTSAAYELYAQRELSTLTSQQIDAVHRFECPPEFDQESRVIFRLANQLFLPGPLNESIWREAKSVLSIDGATAVVHYVGFYKYIATILNGFDAKAPEG